MHMTGKRFTIHETCPAFQGFSLTTNMYRFGLIARLDYETITLNDAQPGQ